MKRICAAALALALLASLVLPARAAQEEWAMVLAALASDDPQPVPEDWQLRRDTVYQAPGLDSQVLNVLLIGTDALDADAPWGRTDVILVCSVRMDTGDVRLAALPETVQVEVAGLPGKVRLKYVHCFGGPGLLMDEINRLLELNIARYCGVNYATFVSLIDRLGGVRLGLTEQEKTAVDWQEGQETLGGDQALRYVKLRWAEAVTDRPRKLLNAVFDQMAALGMEGSFSLAEPMLAQLDTNLTTDDVMNQLFALLGQERMGAWETRALEDMTAEDARQLHGWLYGQQP